MKRIAGLLLLCLLLACAPVATPAPTSTPRRGPTRTPAPTLTPYPTPTPAPTWTPAPTATLAPGAFAQYEIEALRQRSYGGGQVEVTQKVDKNKAYTRYVIRYPSDGLTIYGYADLPRGEGNFPVIIMLHGHSDEAGYSIFAQDTAYAEMYAAQGYLVLHPNFRNFRPSDPGDNRFLTGAAVDVLNLLALVKAGAGQEGIFRHANPDRIGLWAFSMGGAIALKVLTVSPAVRAAFLYSPMSGDDYLNTQFFARAGVPDAQAALAVSPLIFQRLSPQNYYQSITAAVDIHHGLVDSAVPVGWSQQTCAQLQTLGKTIHCYYYEGEDHVFTGNSGVKLKLRMTNFFRTHLKAPPPAP